MNSITHSITHTEEGIQIVATEYDEQGQFVRADTLDSTYATEAGASDAIAEMDEIQAESDAEADDYRAELYAA